MRAKPLSVRRTMLVIAVGLIIILILPGWFFAWRRASRTRTATAKEVQAALELISIKEQVKDVLKEFGILFDRMHNIAAPPANRSSTDIKLPDSE